VQGTTTRTSRAATTAGGQGAIVPEPVPGLAGDGTARRAQPRRPAGSAPRAQVRERKVPIRPTSGTRQNRSDTMPGWFSRLLGGCRAPQRKTRAHARHRHSTARPREDDAAPASPPTFRNWDDQRLLQQRLAGAEHEFLERIAGRILRGAIELPQLPATNMAVIAMAGRPNVEVAELVKRIASDVYLATELLKMSNSVLYATRVQAETVQDAVMRIGLRGLRRLVLAVSMKGVLRSKSLARYSEEIWRQAFSMGSIARAIAPFVGASPDRAFLLGLLHDVGKVALLAVLSDEVQCASDLSPPMVGRVFSEFHEIVGGMLARKWKLSEELASVASCHHKFAENELFSRSAALAALAHQLDLHLSLGEDGDYEGLLGSELMEFLGLSNDARRQILRVARHAFERAHETVKAAA